MALTVLFSLHNHFLKKHRVKTLQDCMILSFNDNATWLSDTFFLNRYLDKILNKILNLFNRFSLKLIDIKPTDIFFHIHIIISLFLLRFKMVVEDFKYPSACSGPFSNNCSLSFFTVPGPTIIWGTFFDIFSEWILSSIKMPNLYFCDLAEIFHFVHLYNFWLVNFFKVVNEFISSSKRLKRFINI